MRSTQTQTIFLILAALISFSTCASRTESLSSLSASHKKDHDGRSLNVRTGEMLLTRQLESVYFGPIGE